MNRGFAVVLLSSLLILVFGYTSISKLSDIHQFQFSLSRMPFIGPGAAVMAWAVPLTELFIVLLLFFPRTRLIGLWGSTLLVTGFGFYLGWMIFSNGALPCSCGGVIAQLGWREHLVMNIVLMGMAGWGTKLAAFNRP